MIGMRLGSIQNTKYTTGSGDNTSKGPRHCGFGWWTAERATAIACDELIDWNHS